MTVYCLLEISAFTRKNCYADEIKLDIRLVMKNALYKPFEEKYMSAHCSIHIRIHVPVLIT